MLSEYHWGPPLVALSLKVNDYVIPVQETSVCVCNQGACAGNLR